MRDKQTNATLHIRLGSLTLVVAVYILLNYYSQKLDTCNSFTTSSVYN